jgi:hypothetical protein
LGHFHATLLDPIVSEKQKQARLGWATVHMARHYTDAIEEEDRRAATYVASVLRGEPQGSETSDRPSTMPTPEESNYELRAGVAVATTCPSERPSIRND